MLISLLTAAMAIVFFVFLMKLLVGLFSIIFKLIGGAIVLPILLIGGIIFLPLIVIGLGIGLIVQLLPFLLAGGLGYFIYNKVTGKEKFWYN